MARRGSRNTDAPKSDESAVETQEQQQGEVAEAAAEPTQEDTVATVAETEIETPAEAEQPEQAEAPTEAPESAAPAAAEAPAEKTPDELHQEFVNAVETVVLEADDTTGAANEASLSKALIAYRALPSSNAKSKARNWVSDDMRVALIDRDIPRARALADISKAVTDATTRRSAAAPARPAKTETEQYIDRLITLNLAGQFVTPPKELDENWKERFDQAWADLFTGDDSPVEVYRAWLAKSEEERGDEPDVDQLVKDAAKIAAGRGVGGRKSSGPRKASAGGGSGKRGDVAKHIAEFLATVEVGTEHTVAEVSNFHSTEYQADGPSAGAVAARLFPAGDKPSTIPGFEFVEGSSPKKIRKI